MIVLGRISPPNGVLVTLGKTSCVRVGVSVWVGINVGVKVKIKV